VTRLFEVEKRGVPRPLLPKTQPPKRVCGDRFSQGTAVGRQRHPYPSGTAKKRYCPPYCPNPPRTPLPSALPWLSLPPAPHPPNEAQQPRPRVRDRPFLAPVTPPLYQIRSSGPGYSFQNPPLPLPSHMRTLGTRKVTCDSSCRLGPLHRLHVHLAHRTRKAPAPSPMQETISYHHPCAGPPLCAGPPPCALCLRG